MTIIPIRDVAKYGIITDQDAYDLPPEAWSLGCNVRFQNRKVLRGPVWRAVGQPLSESNPRFVVKNTFNTGQDEPNLLLSVAREPSLHNFPRAEVLDDRSVHLDPLGS